MRVLRIPTEQDLRSRLRAPEVAARVGIWLGVCFAIAFLTGIYSSLHREQPDWLTLPTRPVWLYALTQGMHYLTGVAIVPLLLVKMYAVYPRLFVRPPAHLRRLVLHLLERASVALLVAAALFQVATGLANASQWYPWLGAFPFRATHYAMAFVVVGAIALHIAVKLPVIRDALSRPVDPQHPGQEAEHPDSEQPDSGQLDSERGASTGLSRRGLLTATGAAAGVGVLSVAGGSVPVPLLRTISVFENHYVPGGGVPINKSARAVDVTRAALDPAYRLTVVNGARELTLSRADLAGLPQHTARLPLACVEGWSAFGDWTGVRLRDLMALADVPEGTTIRAVSLQERGSFRSSEVRGNVVGDPLTLVALRLGGEELSLDHGYPCRLIAPGRVGVYQTKWLARLEAQP